MKGRFPMNEKGPLVVEWMGERPPREAEIRKLLAGEGLSAYSWSNRPGDVYSPHSHNFHKVIYVLKGSITFGLTEDGTLFKLKAGDRLELPANIVHNAKVGLNGVTCLEAHR
jgi:quercetin dioxygenase-like cupin family protein